MTRDSEDRAPLRQDGPTAPPAEGTGGTESSLRVAYESALLRIEELERELRGLYRSPSWRLGHRIVKLGHSATGAVLKGRFAEMRLPWRARGTALQGDDADQLLLALSSETWSPASNALAHLGPAAPATAARWAAAGGRVFQLPEPEARALEGLLAREQLKHVALLRLDGQRLSHRLLDELPWSRLRPRFLLVSCLGRRPPAADLGEAAQRLSRRGYHCLRSARHRLVTPLTGLHRWWRLPEGGSPTPAGAPPHGCLVACQRRSDFHDLCGLTRAGS